MIGLSSPECFYSGANHASSWRSQRISEAVCRLFVCLFILWAGPSHKAHSSSLFFPQSSIPVTTPTACNTFAKVKGQCLATHLKDFTNLANSVVLNLGQFCSPFPRYIWQCLEIVWLSQLGWAYYCHLVVKARDAAKHHTIYTNPNLSQYCAIVKWSSCPEAYSLSHLCIQSD